MLLMKMRWLYWSVMLAQARGFSVALEKTITNERRRAADAVHHAEMMESRARIELNVAIGRQSA